MTAEESLTRREKWETEKQMLQKLTEEEVRLHLQSGRAVWQECPTTWGAYEYKDLHDYEKKTVNARAKDWTEGLEFEPGEEDLEKFFELYDAEALSVTGPKGSLGKGKGKQGAETPEEALERGQNCQVHGDKH